MKRWPTKPLGDLLKVQNGFAFDSERFNDAKHGLPIIRIRDLARGYSETSYDGEHNAAYEVNDGDFLIGMDGEFKCYRWHGGKALLNQRVCRLQGFDAGLNSSYVFYGINQHLSEIEANTSFVTVKHLSSKQIAQIKMPVPPLAEQERIVKLLDEADELRKLRAQATSRTAALLPASFNEMFGDPATNPHKWRKTTLGELCELVNGAPFKPSDWDGSGFPIIRIQNLNDATKPFNYTSKRLPEKFRVRPGDVLLSWSGTPGTSFGCFRWSGSEGWLNQHIFNVKLQPGLDGEFFIESVNVRLSEIIGKAHGGVGLQHITKGTLNEVEMLVPPLPLQKAFAQRVTEIRELETCQATSRTRLDALFQSMLHRAFNGEL